MPAAGLKAGQRKNGLTQRRAPAAAPQGGNTIFLVHGQDEERKLEVAAFLRRVTKLHVAITDKKAPMGRTVIEKFEQNAARAAYAVDLVTADDQGRPVGAKAVAPARTAERDL